MESEPELILLPPAFEHVDPDHLCRLIADMLQRLIEHNDRIPLSPEALTRFHSRTGPNISVLDYLRRIVQYTRTERWCLLITLHYIDQICERNPRFTITSLTCHRFVITSISIASKTFCDSFSRHSVYAKVGGISTAELNVLEREFLRMIEWRLTCNAELLHKYYVNLVRSHSKSQFIIVGGRSSESGSSSEHSEDEEIVSVDVVQRSRPATPGDVIMETVSTGPGGSQSVSNFMGVSMPSTERPYQGQTPPTIEQNMAFADLQRERLT
ncbi:cyclin-domain-containing protein [Thelephora terrestris]|uniref:Cyclin-domain-containing protein n=1 Tax=Thelephora terrestris TaxID=56493 RepID=A0A9P6HTM3_9AGAM|nr:cyclin-domain-containing protein [Thelephora terrestris]